MAVRLHRAHRLLHQIVERRLFGAAKASRTRGSSGPHATSAGVSDPSSGTRCLQALAVQILGLGIGASTAVFTLISSSALRPLPVEEPNRLARLYLGDRMVEWWAHPVWREIERRSDDAFDGAFASGRTAFDVAESGESRFIEGLWASGRFFETLGVQPVLGRAFTAGDDRPGCGTDGAVTVISHRFWHEHFGGGRTSSAAHCRSTAFLSR